MTIYVDVIWGLNFLFDMMLLMLTQALIKEKIPRLRLILGALVASMIVPFTLFFPASILATVYGKILFSFFIILSTFGFQTIYRFFKQLFTFYFITFSVGGALVAVHFLFHQSFTVSLGGLLTFRQGFGDPVSWLFVIGGFPLAWFFTKRRMDQHAAEKIRYDQLCPVTISIFNQSYSTMGYIDSGNQLVDPLTRQPVIICDEPFLTQWVPLEEWTRLKQVSDSLDLEKIPKKWEQRTHIVPYQGVAGKSQFLLAIRPDKLTVMYEHEPLEVHKVLIGLQFSSLTKDHRYHCLLHPQIIKNGAVATA